MHNPLGNEEMFSTPLATADPAFPSFNPLGNEEMFSTLSLYVLGRQGRAAQLVRTPEFGALADSAPCEDAKNASA